jgi:hypothetical protein
MANSQHIEAVVEGHIDDALNLRLLSNVPGRLQKGKISMTQIWGSK